MLGDSHAGCKVPTCIVGQRSCRGLETDQSNGCPHLDDAWSCLNCCADDLHDEGANVVVRRGVGLRWVRGLAWLQRGDVAGLMSGGWVGLGVGGYPVCSVLSRCWTGLVEV